MDSKRTEISLDIYELVEEGLASVGKWNTTEGMSILRANPVASLEENESMANKSFVVITCLVSNLSVNRHLI